MTKIAAVAAEALAEQERNALRRRLRWSQGAHDRWLDLDGRRALSLCSNDYLGFSSHPALRAAAARAAQEIGVGAGASRLVSGSMQIHRMLEQELASFKHTESALVFPSGYHANIGLITSLVDQPDVVFSDALNHASIVDGCRLSRARVHVYPHCDVGALEHLLAHTPARRRLIATDSVFSMDGDLAPLREICALAQQYGAMVLVDEAHATGVIGPTGAGGVEHLGLRGRVDAQMVTLGKALGCAGAAVCGSQALIELLVNRARSFIYTTAVPPPVAAAALAAVGLVRSDPERRQQLGRNAERLRAELRQLGYRVGDGEAAIIPVHVGDNAEALQLSSRLLDHGVFAQAIRPPTVPQGTARLRVTVMATHTSEDLDHAVAAFRAARMG